MFVQGNIWILLKSGAEESVSASYKEGISGHLLSMELICYRAPSPKGWIQKSHLLIQTRPGKYLFARNDSLNRLTSLLLQFRWRKKLTFVIQICLHIQRSNFKTGISKIFVWIIVLQSACLLFMLTEDLSQKYWGKWPNSIFHLSTHLKTCHHCQVDNGRGGGALACAALFPLKGALKSATLQIDWGMTAINTI